MAPNPLDDRTVDRLLAGTATAQDAPPGYERVAALLSAARPVPASEQLPLEAATVAMMQGAISTQVPLTSTRRKKMLGKVLTAKVAAVAGALMLTATGAAAATGSLPGAAQQVASDALSKIGISVPGHNSHAGEHPDSRGKSADHANKGQSDDDHTTGPNEHAHFGQCTAQAASAGHPNDNSAVAGATDCTNVTHPGNSSGDDHGQSGDDHGSSGEHTPPSTPAGPPASTPGSDHAHATTPNQGQSGEDHSNSTASTANDAGSSGTGTSGDHGRP